MRTLANAIIKLPTTSPPDGNTRTVVVTAAHKQRAWWVDSTKVDKQSGNLYDLFGDDPDVGVIVGFAAPKDATRATDGARFVGLQALLA